MEVEAILTQIFGVYPSLNTQTTAAERAQFTLEEFVVCIYASKRPAIGR